MIVLGIESSCDETGVAICKDGRIVSSVISSQVVHQRYGGVVPEIASREHEKVLNLLVDQSLDKAGLAVSDLGGVAVTRGPGLAGTLLTGVCFAKGLALGLDIPIVGVNHVEAHVFANFLADPTLKFPFVCLLVSGGHTQLWLIEGLHHYTLLGETRDDAAGEALDKGARVLGLGYPGGPEIEALSRSGNPNKIKFPRAFLKSGNLDFSFSGLKTSLLYFMDDFSETDQTIRKQDIAASYQQAVVDVLSSKLGWAADQTGVDCCVVAGGVAANRVLRTACQKQLFPRKVLFPDMEYCTDNGAMIAFLGEIYLSDGRKSNPEFTVDPNLRMENR
ncbi:MAG: tRNA (adenosine(37)-N6)-threonylcarbamoyltransferase complex transferase subunit TsaD [FCB group bacterium]|nr:tRNA (adenosine(37)-N6)-threonylcarbamoyltransferase complex transferase subunit TsaD [FCB group bacterium]